MRFISNLLALALLLPSFSFAKEIQFAKHYKTEILPASVKRVTEEYNKLKSVKDAIAYMEDDAFLKARLKELPSDMDLPSVEPKSNGWKIRLQKEKMEIDLNTHTIHFHGKTTSYKGKSSEELYRELTGEKKVTSSFGLFSEAHAVVAYIAAAVLVVAVGMVLIAQEASNGQCRAKSREAHERFQYLTAQCEGQVEKDLHYNKIIDGLVSLGESGQSKSCTEEVRRFFKPNAQFTETESCLSQAMADQICKDIKKLEDCINANKKGAVNQSSIQKNNELKRPEEKKASKVRRQ